MLKNNLADAKAKQLSMEIARMVPALGATAQQTGGDLAATGAALRENQPPGEIPGQQEYGTELSGFSKMMENNPKMRELLGGIVDATSSPK